MTPDYKFFVYWFLYDVFMTIYIQKHLSSTGVIPKQHKLNTKRCNSRCKAMRKK